MRQAEAAQDAPDRDAVNFDTMTIRHLQHQIIQGQIRLCQHPRFDPAPKTGQLTVPATIALRARHQTWQDAAARLLPQKPPRSWK